MKADVPWAARVATKSRSVACTVSIACAMASLPGCYSNAKLTTAETEAHEIQGVKNAIEEIQKDPSLRPKEKEDAIRRLQERLSMMTSTEGPAK